MPRISTVESPLLPVELPLPDGAGVAAAPWLAPALAPALAAAAGDGDAAEASWSVV